MVEPGLILDPIEPNPSTPQRPPLRRWLRFGLRTMLMFIAAVAIPLGWWVNSVREQARAVATIRAAYPYATILYDDVPPAEDRTVTVLAPQPVAPRSPWFGGIIAQLDHLPPGWRLPKDYLHSVALVVVRDDKAREAGTTVDNHAVVAAVLRLPRLEQLFLDVPVDDADLIGLPRLTRLRHLDLDQPAGLTDAGMASIGATLSLRHVNLRDCPVTDAGLARLGTLRHLEELMLDGQPAPPAGPAQLRVSGTGLAELASLPHFQTLILYSNCLTPQGIAAVGRLRHLSVLELSGPVTATDLPTLTSLTEIDLLSLRGTQIQGPGWQVLGRFPKLRHLLLNHNQIDDASLLSLARISTLERLDLSGHQATPVGIAALRSRLPLVDIQDHDPGPPGPAAPPTSIPATTSP